MKTCCITLVMIICIALCSCAVQPAYMTPYKDGSGVRPVTMSTIKTNTTQETTVTTGSAENVTSTKKGTTTSSPKVPEGYRLCPECGGEKLICNKCNGTGKALESVIEYLDEDSGVFVKKGDPCPFCEEDPGYQFCDNCDNKLTVPNKTKATSY